MKKNNDTKKDIKEIDVFNVEIIKRYVNLEDKTQSFKLKIKNNGCTNTVIMKRSEVFGVSEKLYDYGANIPTQKDFKNDMLFKEPNAPIKHIHSGLGWDKYKDKNIFKAYSAVGIKSAYNGKFDIKPKGSQDEWIECIKKYAMPQIPLQFAVVSGMSAVTAGFLKDGMDGSIFVHIYGESSKGKTTAAMLALSAAGNPNPMAKNTLFGDWGDTANYRISMLAGNHGFPIVFDELSKADSKDLSKFVYNLTNSKDKGRLKSNAEQRDVSTWSTTVLSTGESSLLARCNNNGGLLVRVLEICPDEITASAEQAEALKEGIIHNYGWANSILAGYYLKKPKSVVSVFNQYREHLKKEIPINNELVNRLIKKLAVIITTAYFAKKVFDLDFDTKAIKKLLIEAVLKQNEEHPFEQSKLLVDCLLSDLATSPDKYVLIKQRKPLNDIFGKNIRGFIREIPPIDIGEEQCSVELIFPTGNFERLLNNWGFTNKLKELKALDEKGFIKKEGKHYSIRRKIAGKKFLSMY
ncbi:MAG: DUF927 domain-containing protein [Eubacterium sp.]|nr:DUF927 domain-containing protein [Eubacterium sp.]